jgi:hypothetical protein
VKKTRQTLEKIRGAALRAQTGFLMAAAGCSVPGTVWAGKLSEMLGTDNTVGDQTIDTAAGFSIVKTLIDVATWLFVFMGAFYLLPGLFKLINSLRNNQPEETSGAAKDVAIGIVLCMFKVLWKGVSGVLF